MDVLKLIENLKNPEILATMPMGDKLMAGLFVTLLGMTITFIGLMLLWILIEIMSKLLYRPQANPVKVVNQAPAAVANLVPAVQTNNADEIDGELIAVITAAVAASLKTGIHNIVVRNVTRVQEDTPAWARVGRIDQMNGRF